MAFIKTVIRARLEAGFYLSRTEKSEAEGQLDAEGRKVPTRSRTCESALRKKARFFVHALYGKHSFASGGGSTRVQG